jgi:hypothetical protein
MGRPAGAWREALGPLPCSALHSSPWKWTQVALSMETLGEPLCNAWSLGRTDMDPGPLFILCTPPMSLSFLSHQAGYIPLFGVISRNRSSIGDNEDLVKGHCVWDVVSCQVSVWSWSLSPTGGMMRAGGRNCIGTKGPRV